MVVGRASDDVPARLTGVVKRYGRQTVLDDVTLDVPPGITGLVGPNGAGKSTLVRVVLGLVRRCGGAVSVFGHDPARAAWAVRRLVGVMPEDDCFVPGLTGVETVCYAARLSGLRGTEGLRRAHEVLDWCDAGQERYRPVETLSVGMRQKVTFASAIVHDPALVILDEPTNGLDPIERRAMLGRLVTLARDHGKAVLVSTHVLRDVEAICDRMVVLVGGRVRLSGSISALTEATTTTLRLEATGPLEPVVAALAARGLAARIAPGSGAAATAILIEAGGGRVREVWGAARQAGAEVRLLEPATKPLEAVFLAVLAAAESNAEQGASHAAP